jgi:hypothetical protein
VWLLIGIYSAFAPHITLARERAWLASLPFEVDDYMRCLADKPGLNETSVRLHFAFTAAPPAPRELRDRLEEDGGCWSVASSDCAVRTPGIDSGGARDHNRALRTWFHALVSKQLLPLHAKYPFDLLTLANDLSL